MCTDMCSAMSELFRQVEAAEDACRTDDCEMRTDMCRDMNGDMSPTCTRTPKPPSMHEIAETIGGWAQTCAQTCVQTWAQTCLQACVQTCVRAFARTCVQACAYPPMPPNMKESKSRIGRCVQTCAETCVQTCAQTCVQTCVQTCAYPLMPPNMQEIAKTIGTLSMPVKYENNRHTIKA